jgi:hypothetical protein
MALTQISDVVVPEVFTDYVQLLTAERSALIQSGVIETSPFFDGLLIGGGTTFNVPHFKDLDNTESNVSTDQDAGVNDMTPLKTTTGREIAIRLSRNQGWSSADLAGDLAGADPMESIASRVADYWVRQAQAIVIASIQGVIADNIANDAGDMVVDITNGALAVTAANLFSAESFIDAIQTMGDVGEDLVAIAVHSVVYRRMQKNNLIDFIPDSEGRIVIPTFLGRRVIVDDGLPVVANAPNFEYSSYLFGSGSIVAGVGSARVPTEVEREARAGQGGGIETLHNRVEWLYHPRGTAFLEAGIALASPTNAELAAAAQWDRRFERKLVKIAELRTNG